MNRRRYLFSLFRATAGPATGLTLWRATTPTKVMAYRPLPDDREVGRDKDKRHRHGKSNGKGHGKGKGHGNSGRK